MPEVSTVTQAQTIAENLQEKIRSRSARVGIVGLGCVGLPLAVEFARAGFEVTGIDVSQTTADRVNRGDSYVGDVLRAVLKPLVESENLRATSNFFSRARPGRHQHLRADALAQDQGSGHELYRLGMPGNCTVLPPGTAGDLGVDHLPRDHG